MDISRRTVLTSLAAAVALPLTGCAAQIRAESASGPAGTPATPAPTVPVTIGVPAGPLTLDPALAVDAESHRCTRQVLETLLGVDPNTGAPVPLLASDWRVSGDGRRYTFSLEPGVVFQDGTALDADTVAANFERWARLPELLGRRRMAALPHLSFASVFGGYAGDDGCRYVECQPVGTRTVSLVLREPIVFLPAALAAPAFALSSPPSWAAFDDALAATPGDALPPARPAGTGPFRWPAAVAPDGTAGPDGGAAGSAGGTTAADATTGGDPAGADALVLEADPDYRGGASAVGPVTLAVVPDAHQRLRELRRGRLDAFDYVTPDTLRPLVQGGAQVLQRDPLSVLYLGMNARHPVMRQLYVRQAVAHAVDRRALAEECFLAGSSAAHEFVPPSLGVQNPELTRYGHDPAEATRLLELAGYRGEPLDFLYPVETSRPYLPAPEVVYARIAGDLAEAGFVINPVPVPWEEGYLARLGSGTDRAFHLSGRTGEYRDPHHFLHPLFGHGSVEFGYENPMVVEALDDAVSETVPERRTALYQKAAESLALDLPALPLAFPISAVATGHDLVSYPTSPVLDERFDRIVPVDRPHPTQ
ncbi:ABC transporter substrate-binding protein [Citricoccus sp. SGAir0253]|uniref:ABC transporter substrate-binding protein n=1 Tax=Citricoccus sp. SGAir0253 TaxID=2567881 RepID=UPI0010CD5897|nr:ABC transporter substrate-binding protein [Citricoccus sp. SGAir0253]QCU78387.1 ABC transporter substrate-binding protein [Citricoccus sp. SGAir0253]